MVMIFDSEKKAVNKLRAKRKREKELKKTLTNPEKKEIDKMGGLLNRNQQKSLVSNLMKLKNKGGQEAVNKAVRNLISASGGYKAQKKAKTGGNPDIQKKQGFWGAKGMKMGPTKKAGGGKVKKKK